MAGKHEIDMTKGAILPKIVLFSIPLIASSVLQLLFNAADVIVVGRFVGPEAMAAVGSTTSLINLIIQLFVGISVGVNVCVAQYYAANRDKELSETISTSILSALLFGFALVFLGIALSKPMLTLMGTPDDVIQGSIAYIRIYFLGMPAIMLYDFVAAILRAVGDTKRPLYFQLIAGCINVVLNLIFVLFFKFGVAGVAMATSISQLFSAVALVVVLMKEEGRLHLDIKKLHINTSKLMTMMRIGIPAGLQGTVFSLSNVVIQSSINSFGSAAMAGSTASQNIEGFVYVSMNSIYQTGLSFTSQNYGAGKYERIDKILMNCLVTVIVIGLVLGSLAYYFSPQLLSLYTTSPEVIRLGRIRLFIICVPYFLCGMQDTMVGILRGLNYSLIPMIVSLIGACGTRIVFIATLFQLPVLHNLSVLYMSYPVTWTITFTAHVITYIIARKKFMGKKV